MIPSVKYFPTNIVDFTGFRKSKYPVRDWNSDDGVPDEHGRPEHDENVHPAYECRYIVRRVLRGVSAEAIGSPDVRPSNKPSSTSRPSSLLTSA